MNLRIVILFLLGALASANAEVSFEPAKNYPNLGFMMPRLAHAKGEPLPMPKAQSHLLVGGEELAREDRFKPHELWYTTQCCARWRDPAGNRLIIGRITHRLPSLTAEHVSRERFGMELEDDANRVDPKSRAHINEWVATFVDTAVYEPEPLKLNGFTLDEVLYYPCDAKDTLVYAFRPRRVGNANPFGWFCVTLQAPGAADRDALRETFEERFIGQLSLPTRSEKDEGVEAEEVSTVRKDEKLPDQPYHPVRIEARRSVENLDDWWFAETDGYIILSDVTTDVGKSVIRDLQEKMPVLREAFAKLVPPLTRENDVSLIRLFQSRDDYVRYVGTNYGWSSGMWMPARRELVLMQQRSKDEMMQVIQHEAFHQYLSYAYCMLYASPWMNEGHACLFETASVSSQGKVSIEEDPERSILLSENLDDAVALLPTLLGGTPAEFYTGPDISLNYALAWGLSYYLQKGAPLELNTPFKNILAEYAAALAQTHDEEEATLLAFKDVDMAVFQENFREFWLKRRSTARHFDPLKQ